VVAGGGKESSKEVSLGKVIVFNWVLLGLLTGAAWLGYSGFHALSVLFGGAVANVSFLFLKRDLVRLLGGPLEAVKPLFFMRYYLRLSAVVGVLFLLIKFQLVHTLSLLVGLSTVLLGIGLAVMVAAKTIYSTKA
jgi:hypothetical protein